MQLQIRDKLSFPASYSPGIKGDHPAAAKLLIATVAINGNHVALTRGGARGTIVGTPTRKMNRILGETVAFPGATDRSNFGSFPTASVTNATIAAIFQLDVAPSLPIDVAGDSNGSNVGVGIGVIDTGEFTIRFGNFFTMAGSIAKWAVGVPYFIAASVSNGTTNYVVKRLDNGQLRSASFAVGASSSIGTGTFVVGGRDSTSGRNSRGPVACTMRSNSSLSLQQLLVWADDPWSFWYPDAADDGPQSFAAWVMGLGGAVYNQTLSTTVAATNSLRRGVNKVLANSATATNTLLKRVTKTFSTSSTAATTLSAIKGGASVILLTFSTSVGSTTALTKRAGKVLTNSASASNSLIKGVRKNLTTTCSAATSFVARKCIVYLKTITTSVIATPSINAVLTAFVDTLQTELLKLYRPNGYPTLNQDPSTYILAELKKISSFLAQHVQITKDLEKRINDGGL